MPKVKPRKAKLYGWIFLCALAGAALYLLWLHPLIVGSILVAVLAWTLISNARTKRRLRTVAMAREGESICEFARSFDRHAVDPWIIRAVYEEVQSHLKSFQPAFPLRSTDRLVDDLDIDSEDLELDVASTIAERAGRSMRASDANPLFGKVHTVGDLVMFFNRQPKEHAT